MSKKKAVIWLLVLYVVLLLPGFFLTLMLSGWEGHTPFGISDYIMGTLYCALILFGLIVIPAFTIGGIIWFIQWLMKKGKPNAKRRR